MKELIKYREKDIEYKVLDLLNNIKDLKEYKELNSILLNKKLINEARFAHNEKGQFPSKDEPKKGMIYSMSKDGAKSAGISDDYVGRGTYTGNKRKDGSDKVSYSFGMASGKKACGCKDIQKGDITPKYSCKDYSDLYEVELDEGETEQKASYLRGVIMKAIRDEIQKLDRSNGCSYKDMLKMINLYQQSSKGELGKAAS